jgi:hypothetical protein
MWNFNPQPQTSKPNSKSADAKESPMCVASMSALFLPSDLQLNSPKRAQEKISLPPPPKLHDFAASEPSESESENDKGRAERLAALMQLQGVELMRALQQVLACACQRRALARPDRFSVCMLEAHERDLFTGSC